MIACKDCRFHDDGYGNNCCHASVMRPDPVHGWALETCHNARAEGGKCGPDARFFVTRRASVASVLGLMGFGGDVGGSGK